MQSRARNARLFRKPSLLVLGAISIVLPLAIVALLRWDSIIRAATPPCRIDALETPAIYIEHVGDSDKPVQPLAIATRMPGHRELCAAINDPFLRRLAHPHIVSDEELARATTLVETNGTSSTQDNEFRYVIVEKERNPRFGSLDLERSRKLMKELTLYFVKRRPDLTEELNELRGRLGDDSPIQ